MRTIRNIYRLGNKVIGLYVSVEVTEKIVQLRDQYTGEVCYEEVVNTDVEFEIGGGFTQEESDEIIRVIGEGTYSLSTLGPALEKLCNKAKVSRRVSLKDSLRRSK
jgi:hypothetical protein